MDELVEVVPGISWVRPEAVDGIAVRDNRVYLTLRSGEYMALPHSALETVLRELEVGDHD
jgi:hypothetical protein